MTLEIIFNLGKFFQFLWKVFVLGLTNDTFFREHVFRKTLALLLAFTGMKYLVSFKRYLSQCKR